MNFNLPCHGPRTWAIHPRRAGDASDSFTTADAVALGGRVVKLVLRPRFARTGGRGHDNVFYRVTCAAG